MGAGRSRIPRISHNCSYKPYPNAYANANMIMNNQQRCMNKLIDCTPKTFEVKIPVPYPYQQPVPVPVPVAKPYPVQVPVAVPIRIPVPVKVPVDCPVPVPIKVPVPKIVKVPVQANQKSHHFAAGKQPKFQLNKPQAYANIQQQQHQHYQHQHPHLHQHMPLYPNHFADHFYHNHHHQNFHQQDLANQCCTQRVQMNDTFNQDTQNTGKSFENLATADILGGGIDTVDYITNENNQDNSNNFNTNTSSNGDQIQSNYNQSVNQMQDSSSGVEGNEHSLNNASRHRTSSVSEGIIRNQFTNFMLNSNPVSSQSPPTKIFDASYMAPLLAPSENNMNTSFVSSLKTSYLSSANPYQQSSNQHQNQHQISSSSSSHELEDPTKSSSSLKTLIKNPSPVTVFNNRSLSATRDSQKLKSTDNIDNSDQSLVTYRSSRQSSKNKRTSAGADSYLTPPFTPTRISHNLNNNASSNILSNGRGSHSSGNTMGSGFLSNSSMLHTVQFQKSSIHNTNTPGDQTTNTSKTGTFFSTTSPSKNTLASSGRTSFQTSTTFDPTSITPNSSSLMIPRTPLFKSSGNTDLIPQNMNGNSFMQFNKDSNNPNSKDFSYMLFNIKVFRTPKEQS